MQLSFLYAATVFAAAWAGPVSDSAQPVSKRAVPYHADTLQATLFALLQTGSSSKGIGDYRSGGTGGDSFSDMTTLERFDVAPTINLVVLLTGTKVNHVKLSGFFGDPSVPYDAPHGHNAQSLTVPKNSVDVHLDLAEGEWLTFVSVQTDGPEGIDQRLVHMRFETNLNNKVEAGFPGPSAVTRNFTAPAGFSRIVGLHGTDGDWVDSIAPIWA